MRKLKFNHQYPMKYLHHFGFHYFDVIYFSFILKIILILVDLQSKDHFQEVKDTLISFTVLITFYFVEPMFLQISFLFILLINFVFVTIMGILEDNIDLILQTLCLRKVKVFYKPLEEVIIY